MLLSGTGWTSIGDEQKRSDDDSDRTILSMGMVVPGCEQGHHRVDVASIVTRSPAWRAVGANLARQLENGVSDRAVVS
jgi:hypothetical protein